MEGDYANRELAKERGAVLGGVGEVEEIMNTAV